jgi:alkylhydroperoxidase family enzyme
MIDPRKKPEWGDEIPEQLLARLAAEPTIGAALRALGDALMAGLDGRTLELVALRVSAVRDNRYVWAGHCAIALTRPHGRLTVEEIARVAAGPQTLSGADAVTVQAVDDLLTLRRLGGATRQALGERALAVTIATSFYDMVVTVMRDAAPDASPIAGLETPALATSAMGPGRS